MPLMRNLRAHSATTQDASGYGNAVKVPATAIPVNPALFVRTRSKKEKDL
jgi:hypothetical protein